MVLTCGDAALQRVPQSSSWRPSVLPRSFPNYPPAGWPRTTWVRIGSEGPLPRSPYSPSGHREKPALPEQTLARPRTWVRRGNAEGLPRHPYPRSTCTYARKHLRNRPLATALRRRANDNEPSRRVLGRGTSYRPQPARRSSDPASAQPLDAPERRHRRRRPVAAISLPTMQRPRKGSPTSTNSPTTPSVGKARRRGRNATPTYLTHPETGVRRQVRHESSLDEDMGLVTLIVPALGSRRSTGGPHHAHITSDRR